MARDRDIPYSVRIRVASSVPGHPGVVSRRANGYVTKILCKGCGEEIASLVNGSFTRSLEYREILFEFDDKSAHVSHCCVDCLDILEAKPNEERLSIIEAWYCIDIIDWIGSIEQTGGGSISARDAVRVPTGIGVH